jgi:iron complex outermembrane receptor protein
MSGPHHIVMLNMVNSQNTFLLNGSILKLNVGGQSNIRMEDEGGGSISLNMHLTSLLQNLKWEKEISKKTTFVANQQLTFENNTNYGGRILIPDANFLEYNTSGYFKFSLNKVILEAGAGVNSKHVQTFQTGTLNTPGEQIQPFTRNFLTGNGMLGAVYNPTEWLTLKTNTGSGYRAPNLAELSSNGVHEGVYRYEIGDPNMKPEQNLNSDFTMEVDKGPLFLSASTYYDRFFNYVYLAGSNKTYYTFPVFYYKQQDAKIYGGEFLASLKPESLKGLEWKESFTMTRGILDFGGNLPFIPAYKLSSALHFEKRFSGRLSALFVEPEYVYVFKQDKPAQFETATGDYYLLNLTSAVTITAPHGNWRLGLTGTNLTNNAYADHLSRLKYYGILNEGLNFVVSVRKDFKW